MYSASRKLPPSTDQSTRTGNTKLKRRSQSGMTLIELIVAITIVMVLAAMVMPVARFAVRREKERELRRDLYGMRDAIDQYKDATDRGLIKVKLGTEGYPP